MAIVRRCDSCRLETPPPTLLSEATDDWFYVYQLGGEQREQMNFCTIKCIQDYFTAQRLIEGAT